MAKSKKFKPLLKASDIRCGVTYLRVVVNQKGVVLSTVYKPTCDPYVKPCSFSKTGKALMVDYLCSNNGQNYYRFKDSFVSDMVGVFDGYRYRASFYDCGAMDYINLHRNGLFKFSNKLLEKIKSFENDPIKVYEFLNPGRFFTASERSAIAMDIKERELRDLQKDTSKENIYEFFNIKNHGNLITEEKPYEFIKIKRNLSDYKYYKL